MNFDEKTADVNNTLKCKNCAASLTFAPGTKSLVCQYCGTTNEITHAEEEFKEIEELDYFDYEHVNDAEKYTVQVLKCNSCGASTTYDGKTAASSCPFCTAPLVVAGGGQAASIIKPKSLIAFVIDQNKAIESFKKYAKNQWFAPDAFLKLTKSHDKVKGMYIPYWSFDADVHTQYIGQRGIDYVTTETYTTTENGKTVTRTRNVTRTNWWPVSGEVDNNFDDLMVTASSTLPVDVANNLDPWDSKGLVPYNDSYIAGFVAEMYNIELKAGFESGKNKMWPVIENTICRDIGGDHQRITRHQSNYSNVKFKHALLPIWISVVPYKEKKYYFLVNGQTGKVQGQQPYSAIKIILAVLLALLIIFGIYWATQAGK